jgi:predicted 3-demethylubiquinone-9 3-methyltransferase (glyoxalase superfamily)
MSPGHRIAPNLWFDRQAEEAANLYIGTFENSRILSVTRAGKAGFETTGIPEGTVMTLEFQLEGQRFIGINGGPLFKFNPSISFLISCDTKQQVDDIWKRLAGGGQPLMDIGAYPFSERYGWIQDRYGLSWQVMFSGGRAAPQKITPTLMFVGAQAGKAEAAIRFYTSVFNNTSIGNIMRYPKGPGPDKEGTVQHGSFVLENYGFAAMDSAGPHEFTFNEAVSLMVEVETQQEIDYYWGKLTGDGGRESMCGWLADKFGVSWQVTPTILGKMLQDPDKIKVERVTNAFLKMKKFDIAALRKAYEG